jgi:hypothetical protein
MGYIIETSFFDNSKSFCFMKPKNELQIISFEIKNKDEDVYFGVSKEFNIKKGWDKVTTVETFNNDGSKNYPRKDYFLRKNVLLPILYRLAYLDFKESNQNIMYFEESEKDILQNKGEKYDLFMKVCFDHSYSIELVILKELVKKYGKTNSELINETSKFSIGSKWKYKF